EDIGHSHDFNFSLASRSLTLGRAASPRATGWRSSDSDSFGACGRRGLAAARADCFNPGGSKRSARAFSKNDWVSSTANLGLEGVVAFETEIAEPDKEGSSLRYRGVDIEELAGHVPFEQVWGLIVNESLERGLQLPTPDVAPVSRSHDARVDLQATLAPLAPAGGLQQP